MEMVDKETPEEKKIYESIDFDKEDYKWACL